VALVHALMLTWLVGIPLTVLAFSGAVSLARRRSPTARACGAGGRSLHQPHARRAARGLTCARPHPPRRRPRAGAAVAPTSRSVQLRRSHPATAKHVRNGPEQDLQV
jgi:hypothetical protein